MSQKKHRSKKGFVISKSGHYLEQLQRRGVGVGVLHLQLGPGVVEDGEEVEVAGVGPVAADDEEGAEDGEKDGEDDVEEVEPGVDGEERAAGVQRVTLLLGQVGVLADPGVFLLLLLRGEQVALGSI